MAEELRQNVNEDQVSYPTPEARISKVSMMGEVSISFSVPMTVIDSKIDLKSLTFEAEEKLRRRRLSLPVFNVNVIPAST